MIRRAEILRRALTAVTLLASWLPLLTSAAPGQVLDMRERAVVIDRWLDERVDVLLPTLMRRSGIDMWIIIAREYNEDPVMRTFLPSTWLSARRRTILVVSDPGHDAELETLAVARYDVGSRFRRAWDPAAQPDQWQRLRELIEARDPRQIGINVSSTFALADGLSHTEHEALQAALPERYRQRLVSAEALAISWLETRSDSEMAAYQHICRVAHEIIADGLSGQAIQPGITTTDDVAWWYRQRIRERGLSAWFHPTVSIQRRGPGASNVIVPGDLLHVDFGISYLRLNTDTQQHAYVLQPGEQSAPAELRDALAVGNRLQDILTGEFVTGRSGNDILQRALAKAQKEGISALIYTHPIGYHGHGAGPTIGLWDQQGGVPGRGDYPLHPNTAHSIELSAQSTIDGWHAPVRIKLEEDAFFDGQTIRYIDGRQTNLLLIPRQNP